MAGHPLRSATHRRLGRPLPHQLANASRAHPQWPKPFTFSFMRRKRLSGISSGFPKLSQSWGQVAHVLLTRSPLCYRRAPLDLHVLGTPPAFVLSQDQTLHDRESLIAHLLAFLNLTGHVITLQFSRNTSCLFCFSLLRRCIVATLNILPWIHKLCQHLFKNFLDTTSFM